MRALLAATAVLSAGILGCGDGEDSFTAEQFVAGVNERGGTMILGEGLPSSREGAELYGRDR